MNSYRKTLRLLQTHTASYPVRFALLALFYLLTERATELIPFHNSSLSPVWFPTGVALFVLVWWGPNLWPAIFLAGFTLGIPSSPVDAIFSLANALEPALAAYLFLKIFASRERLRDLHGMVALLTFGGIVTPVLSGWLVTICSHPFSQPYFIPESADWLLWTAGDFNGIVLTTPLLVGIAFAIRDRKTWSRWKILEFAATMTALILVTGLVFDCWERISPSLDLGTEVIGESFLILPLFAWIAMRFGQPASSIALLISAVIGMWQTVNDHGPYAGHIHEKNLLWFHAFIAVCGTFITLIAAGKEDRDRSEEALLESQEQYRFLFENNPHPMWVFDSETLNFVTVNEAALATYGYSRAEFLAMKITDIRAPERVSQLLEDLSQNLTGVRESHHLRKDGTELDIEISSLDFRRNGHLYKLILANNVTPRKALEAELRQAQKLEALGRLAGGVAHDFNNLIMIMSSYAELIQEHPDDFVQVVKDAEQIRKASDRAAMLTSELLAFSRKQVLNPKVLDLNTVMAETLGMVRRLVGEHIQLEFHSDAALWPVKLDVGQITQLVMNLTANARDAMPRGGNLQIKTGNLSLSEDSYQGSSMIPSGEYVTLTVTDSGEGIRPEVLEHIFEPFFSTKSRGRASGTGLGLATVYGIVKQNSGHIRVWSQPGSGSEFVLYFPKATGMLEPAPVLTAKPLPEGRETILVVEDEEELRSAIVDSLRSGGYRVIHAAHGKHALEIAEGLHSLDLLVTDVVMPQMGGTEIVPTIRKKFPNLKAIYISGYADGMVNSAALDADTIFLSKPFSLRTLASQVRELLTNATPTPQNAAARTVAQ